MRWQRFGLSLDVELSPSLQVRRLADSFSWVLRGAPAADVHALASDALLATNGSARKAIVVCMSDWQKEGQRQCRRPVQRRIFAQPSVLKYLLEGCPLAGRSRPNKMAFRIDFPFSITASARSDLVNATSCTFTRQ